MPSPDERLHAAYAHARQSGISIEALAALGQALGHNQPSRSWPAHLKILTTFWFDLADLACTIYPSNAAAFTALTASLLDDPAAGVVAWLRQALFTIDIVDPDFVHTVRNELLVMLL